MVNLDSYVLRIRRGTEAQWSAANPILSDGEPGFIEDTNLYKIGDGVTLWNDLPYTTGPAGPQGPVGPEGPGALVDEGDVDNPPAELLEGELLYDPNAQPDPGQTAITQDQADARYVNADGDTMTGALTFDNVGNFPLVVGKAVSGFAMTRYLDDGANTFQVGTDNIGRYKVYHVPTGSNAFIVDSVGSVDMRLAATVRVPVPVDDDHAARKQDVDAKVSKDGDTMSGDFIIDKHWPTATLEGSATGPGRLIFSQEGVETATLRGDSSGAFVIIVPGGPANGSIRVNHSDGSVSLLGAPHVSVPAPTANSDAARKTDVDAKVSRDGDTMTGILVAESQVRFGPSGEWRTGYFSDEYRVQRGGNVVFKVNSAGDLITFSAQLAPPIPDAPQRVPRLARTPDPTTGDLGLPNYAGSSTGWRDVSADIEPGYGWTGGTLLIRRDGNRIEMQAYDLTNDGTGEAQNLYAAPSDGFRRRVIGASDTTHSNAIVGVGHGFAPTTTGKGDNLASVVIAGNGVLIRAPHWMTTFTAQWTTVQAWPSSLPGTEVTPPATWS